MSTVLLLSNNPLLRSPIQQLLERSGQPVMAAENADTAIRAILTTRPAAIILDTGIGPEEVESFWEQRQALGEEIPVLILTSREEHWLRNGPRPRQERDRVLTRPCDPEDVQTALNSLLQSDAVKPSPLTVAGAELDPSTQEVRCQGKADLLTPTEFRLLEHIARSPGRIISFEELSRQVWGFPAEARSAELIRAHIHNLRIKLERVTGRRDIIRTVPRRGYRLG